jgi:transposase
MQFETPRIIALDLGVKRISYCEVSNGEVVDRCSVGNLAKLMGRLGPNTRAARVAIEACREAWVVIDRLKEWGHDPILVDTTRSRRLGIGQHGRKTDRIDAETLARALEAGNIPVAHVLSPDRRELRYQLGVRRALVETRAQYVVTIRGLARAEGSRIVSCQVPRFRVKLAAAELEEHTRSLIAPLVSTLETLDTQLELVDAKLRQICSRDSTITLLATTPGVALIIAAYFVSVIDTPDRFRNAHQVEAYLGLVPSEDSSGGRRRIGAITKQGNAILRSVLIQGAWSILQTRRTDEPLWCWANAIAERRGRKIAVVALARRLAGILWAMWRRGLPYDPQHVGLASAKGVIQAAVRKQSEAQTLERAARKIKLNKQSKPVRERTTSKEVATNQSRSSSAT